MLLCQYLSNIFQLYPPILTKSMTSYTIPTYTSYNKTSHDVNRVGQGDTKPTLTLQLQYCDINNAHTVGRLLDNETVIQL